MIGPGHQPTPGEKRIYSLLNALSRREYFFRYEPQIVASGGSSKPDFVVVSARLGVLVIEVKDWRRLAGGTQEVMHVIAATGKTVALPNPLRQAERYAYDLNARFRQRAELWQQRRGVQALRFPWQVMVALPYLPQAEIARFEQVGIWPAGVVLGAEALKDAAALDRAIHALPWKFALEKPLSLDLLDMIREIIDPSLRVDDASGSPIGTLTRAQEALVTEPVAVLQPRQQSLLPEMSEPLPPGHEALLDNPEVRLVRGVAGSGKTLVLARRAHRLASAHADQRFLALTFNRELARDIRERLGLRDDAPAILRLDDDEDDDSGPAGPIAPPAPGLEVTNFHRLCRRLLGLMWMRPFNLRRWLRDHASPELAALGLSPAALADELAWRRERGLLDDAAYLAADRRGRGYQLGQDKRALVCAVWARLAAQQQARHAAGRPWYTWDDVAFLAEEALSAAGHPYAGAYASILIDEGQDFTPSWMRVVRRMLRPGGSLFICDDPSQAIFHSYTWAQKGVSVVGRSVQLRVPFRSTMEISAAAHALIEADDILRSAEEKSELDLMTYELGRGPLPALVSAPTPADEQRFVSAQVLALLADGAPARQIAILCHRYEDMFAWKALQQRGVYVQFFERMKGLEFLNVFVPHLHSAFDDAHDPETVAGIRRKIFTAMTRARYRLVLSHSGPLPPALAPLAEVALSENVPA